MEKRGARLGGEGERGLEGSVKSLRWLADSLFSLSLELIKRHGTILLMEDMDPSISTASPFPSIDPAGLQDLSLSTTAAIIAMPSTWKTVQGRTVFFIDNMAVESGQLPPSWLLVCRWRCLLSLSPGRLLSLPCTTCLQRWYRIGL
jgi:hypothetical protein